MSWMVVFSLLIPLAGTALGSSMVFFLKNGINQKVQKILMGFASGVMIAASIWSLLQPAINTFDKNRLCTSQERWELDTVDNKWYATRKELYEYDGLVTTGSKIYKEKSA